MWIADSAFSGRARALTVRLAALGSSCCVYAVQVSFLCNVRDGLKRGGGRNSLCTIGLVSSNRLSSARIPSLVPSPFCTHTPFCGVLLLFCLHATFSFSHIRKFYNAYGVLLFLFCWNGTPVLERHALTYATTFCAMAGRGASSTSSRLTHRVCTQARAVLPGRIGRFCSALSTSPCYGDAMLRFIMKSPHAAAA